MTGRYTKTAIWLHWLIAIGVLVNIALAWTWPFGDTHPRLGEYVRPMIDTHKSIGITILGLAILRLLWRMTHTPPPMPSGYANWDKRLARIVHWGLYFVIFAMPLTGWIMDSAYKDAATHPMAFFGTSIEWPRLGFIMHLPPDQRDHVHKLFGNAHGTIALLVYLLVVLHVCGALKHHIQGAKELQRMGIGRI